MQNLKQDFLKSSNNSFVFVDVETTGLSAAANHVIDVAIVKVTGGHLSVFESLINPGYRIPPEITRITGIVSSDVANAPTFAKVVQDIDEFTKDSIFVAHNAQFDYSFFKSEFARSGKHFDRQTICTVKLARSLYPNLPRYRLENIIHAFNIKVESRHRALPDALAVKDFFEISTKHPAFEVNFNRLLNSPIIIDY